VVLLAAVVANAGRQKRAANNRTTKGITGSRR